jgi:hypothetical protein
MGGFGCCQGWKPHWGYHKVTSIAGFEPYHCMGATRGAWMRDGRSWPMVHFRVLGIYLWVDQMALSSGNTGKDIILATECLCLDQLVS